MRQGTRRFEACVVCVGNTVFFMENKHAIIFINDKMYNFNVVICQQ